MLASQIEIGQVYVVKVSGKLRPVVVESAVTGLKGRTYWHCRNVVTGRSVLVRGAARFRKHAEIPAADLSEPS